MLSKIRLAQVTDVEEISRLSLELGYPNTLESTSFCLRAFLESSRHFVAVMPDSENSLLGWVAAERRLWLDSGEAIEITGLIVSTSARRKKIGQSLVMTAEEWAKKQGFESVRVCSNIIRKESHPFYQNIGFRLDKTQHLYKKDL